jgi:hypothetical protein
MKTLLISIIFFFSSLFFIFSQDDSVLAETYGIYRLKNIETSITDQESLEYAINWIYEFQFDAITLGKDVIIFGDFIENNPIYNILYKDYESTVKLIIGERHYSVVCSDFLGYYAEIERLYDFVIKVNIPYIFIIELLDNNHIVIKINNLYVLYEKEKS